MFIGFEVHAQGSLAGHVLGTANNPLGYASVYLPQLQKGTDTKRDGSYHLHSIPMGRYAVTVSILGYAPQTDTVDVRDTLTTHNFTLRRAPKALDVVTIEVHSPPYVQPTHLNIAPVTNETIKQSGAMNIGQALAQEPGVSLLSTGVGDNKPVIRGLFGNRILIRVAGLRFDSQQWQDEHASGINGIGISRVDIIKGASSVQYGPDAVGGVIDVKDEEPAPVNTLKAELNTSIYSNTLGTVTDIGVSKGCEHHHWHVRLGVESNADYHDGNNHRVLNSRYDGYYAKAGYGYVGKKWTSENTYQFSLNRYGFVFDSSTYHLIDDARYSRAFDSPHHTVFIHLLSSQNTVKLNNSLLKLTFGFISNHRQEQEGGNKISLDMLLNTGSVQAVWLKPFDKDLDLKVGGYGQFQNNNNVGSRTIIPDANNADMGAFVLLSKKIGIASFEVGSAYNLRYIKTFETGTVNGPGQEVQPFSKIRHSVNGTGGIVIQPTQDWLIRINAATGTRAPNLAELSSDGLHEGTSRYEIGNINLKNEQNINGEVSVGYHSWFFDAGISGFVNHFFQYIYLAPTADEYFGFQIYRFVQQSATLEGGEASVDIRPGIQWLNLHGDYSMVVGKTDAGNYLPYMPAYKLTGDVKVSGDIKKLKKAFVKFGATYVFKQDRPAQFETPTPAYYLLDAGFGGTIPFKHGEISISILGTNILNNTYVDHLSRYKYFGLYSIGRNVSLNISIPLTFHISPKTKNNNQ